MTVLGLPKLTMLVPFLLSISLANLLLPNLLLERDRRHQGVSGVSPFYSRQFRTAILAVVGLAGHNAGPRLAPRLP